MKMKAEESLIPNLNARAKMVWQRNLILAQQRYFHALVGVVVEPVLIYLVFAYGLGQYVEQISVGSYAEFLVPGFTMITVMTVSFIECSVVTQEKMDGKGHFLNFHHVPFSWGEVAVGEIFWGATKGWAAGSIIAFLAYFQGFFTFNSLLVLELVLAATGLSFAALGLLVMAISEKKNYLPFVQAIVILPMYLLSGAFFPFHDLPHFYRQASLLFPVTHAIEFFRSVLSGILDVQAYIHLGIILVFMLGVFVVAIRQFESRFYR